MKFTYVLFRVGSFLLFIILYLSILSSSFIHSNNLQFQRIGEITRIYSSDQTEIHSCHPRKIIEISPSEFVGLWYKKPYDYYEGYYSIGYSPDAINWKIDSQKYCLRLPYTSDCIILDNGTLLIYDLYRMMFNFSQQKYFYSPYFIKMWSITDYDSLPKTSENYLALDPNNTRAIKAVDVEKINNTDFDNVRLFYDRGLYMCSISLNDTIKIWSLPDNMSTFSQISSYQLKVSTYSHSFFFLAKINQKICVFLQDRQYSQNFNLLLWDQENNWQEYPVALSGARIYECMLISSEDNLYLLYKDYYDDDYYLYQLILDPTSQKYFLSNTVKLLSHKEYWEDRDQDFAQIESLNESKIFLTLDDWWDESRVFLYEERSSPDYSGLGSGFLLTALSIIILFLPEKYYMVFVKLIQELREETR